MGGEDIMKTGASFSKAGSFGVVASPDVSHELGHDVSVEVGRSEGVLLHGPSVLE